MDEKNFLIRFVDIEANDAKINFLKIFPKTWTLPK